MKLRKILTSIAIGAAMVAPLALSFPSVVHAASPVGFEEGTPAAIRRWAADYFLFNGLEAEATPSDVPLAGGLGGVPIYTQVVTTSDDINTVYVSIFATGDAESNSGSQTLLSCSIDGVPCNNNGPAFNTAPSGWVVVAQQAQDGAVPDGDNFDVENAVSYSWCVPVLPENHQAEKLKHTIVISLANTTVAGTTGGNVFLEQAHVFVDGSYIHDGTNACQDLDPICGPSGGNGPCP
ncbi:MAG TPA: hypothetical protein VNF45_08885 [Candidatus Binataceae bacterium]|nr:hypothetical protein [Candidatus Binataceae bacterium]